MGKLVRNSESRRWVVFTVVVVMLFSMLFLGTGFSKVNGARSSRRNSRNIECGRWRLILESMASGVPARYKESWSRVAGEHPELMMRVVSAARN